MCKTRPRQPPSSRRRRPPPPPPQARVLFHCAHKRGDEAALMARHQELSEGLEDELSLAAVHFQRAHFQEATGGPRCWGVAPRCWGAARYGGVPPPLRACRTAGVRPALFQQCHAASRRAVRCITARARASGWAIQGGARPKPAPPPARPGRSPRHVQAPAAGAPRLRRAQRVRRALLRAPRLLRRVKGAVAGPQPVEGGGGGMGGGRVTVKPGHAVSSSPAGRVRGGSPAVAALLAAG
jgi:hypothetical protein